VNSCREDLVLDDKEWRTECQFWWWDGGTALSWVWKSNMRDLRTQENWLIHKQEWKETVHKFREAGR
jgi:hypothetical protein